ncbi:uncharacterized protein LOC117175210 [Belonocnema kinseyi]|uniref:uncharacterized protein LOC117175210 n=1 Tax=Belonocnema kinseyi TaxID=2817044 RepID=UPI00143D1F8F|nr:uncharacterized protein LOC117175210 [Belonocnema kinseyi]
MKKMDPFNAGLEGILDVPKLSESHITASMSVQPEPLAIRVLCRILKEIRTLKADVHEISVVHEELKTIMEIERSAQYVSKKTFQEEYNLQLPFKNLEDLNYLMGGLQQTKNAVIDSALNNTLKNYFYRDLMMNFTAVKEVVNKHLFKKYNFCTHLLGNGLIITFKY